MPETTDTIYIWIVGQAIIVGLFLLVNHFRINRLKQMPQVIEAAADLMSLTSELIASEMNNSRHSVMKIFSKHQLKKAEMDVAIKVFTADMIANGTDKQKAKNYADEFWNIAHGRAVA